MELCSMLCGSLDRRGFWGRMDTCIHRWTFLVAQTVKNLPAIHETLVWNLGQEDPLEKEMATHSIILAWRIPWTKEPGRLQSMGSQGVGTIEWLTLPCLCVVESLHCSPATTMTLLISYIPVKNKKLKKENQTILGFSSSSLGSWCEYKRP